MQTFDQSLYFLLQEGLITVEEALKRATNVGEFKLRLEGINSSAEQARTAMSRGMAISSGAGREAGVHPMAHAPAPAHRDLLERKQDLPPADVKITLAR
jgi:twitching motility protein PilT